MQYRVKKLSAAVLASLSFASLAIADTAAVDRISGGVRKVVVDACLAQLPDHPFGGDEVNARVLAPTINVINRTSILLDDTKSAEPELVIIAGTVNILGNAAFKLLNPNAWYCIPANLSIFGTTTIDINSKAHLAQLNVPVSSTVIVRKVDDNGKPIDSIEAD